MLRSNGKSAGLVLPAGRMSPRRADQELFCGSPPGYVFHRERILPRHSGNSRYRGKLSVISYHGAFEPTKT